MSTDSDVGGPAAATALRAWVFLVALVASVPAYLVAAAWYLVTRRQFLRPVRFVELVEGRPFDHSDAQLEPRCRECGSRAFFTVEPNPDDDPLDEGEFHFCDAHAREYLTENSAVPGGVRYAE